MEGAVQRNVPVNSDTDRMMQMTTTEQLEVSTNGL